MVYNLLVTIDIPYSLKGWLNLFLGESNESVQVGHLALPSELLNPVLTLLRQQATGRVHVFSAGLPQRSLEPFREYLDGSPLPGLRRSFSRMFFYTADVHAAKKAIFEALVKSINARCESAPGRWIFVILTPARLLPGTVDFLRYLAQKPIPGQWSVLLLETSSERFFLFDAYRYLVDFLDIKGLTLVIDPKMPSVPEWARAPLPPGDYTDYALDSMSQLAFDDAEFYLKHCFGGERCQYLLGLCHLFKHEYLKAAEEFYPLSLPFRKGASLRTEEQGRVHLYLAYLAYKLNNFSKIDSHLLAFEEFKRSLTGPLDEELEGEQIFFQELLRALRNQSADPITIENCIRRLKSQGWYFELSILFGLYEYLYPIYLRSPEDALRLGREGIRLARKISAKNRIAASSHILGVFYNLSGNTSQAEKYYRTALRLRKEIDDVTETIKILNGYGYFLFLNGHFRRARSMFQHALQLLYHRFDFVEICLTMYNLTLISIVQNRNEEAFEYLDTILQIMKILGIEDLPFHPHEKLLALRDFILFRMHRMTYASIQFPTTALATCVAKLIQIRYESIDPRSLLVDFLRSLQDFQEPDESALKALVALEASKALEERGFEEHAAELRRLAADQAQRLGLTLPAQSPLSTSAPLKKYHKSSTPLGIIEAARQQESLARLQKQSSNIRFLSEVQRFLLERTEKEGLEWNELVKFLGANLDTLSLELILQEGEDSRVLGRHVPPRRQIPLGRTYEVHSPGKRGFKFILIAVIQENAYDMEFHDYLQTIVTEIEAAEQLIRASKELHHAATRDHLTALLNRNALYGIVSQELNRLRRFGGKSHSAHALIYIDLDNFKYINDHFGHAAGDLVLKLFAQFLQAHIRNTDLAGRIGGDEFLVVLIETPLQGASLWAERFLESLRLRRGFVQELRQYLGLEVAIASDRLLSCSMGIAPLDPVYQDWQKCLSLADKALYATKQCGKNGFRIAESSSEP